MKSFTAVVERDPATGLLITVGVSVAVGAVIALLLEDGEPRLEAQFVATQSIAVA